SAAVNICVANWNLIKNRVANGTPRQLYQLLLLFGIATVTGCACPLRDSSNKTGSLWPPKLWTVQLRPAPVPAGHALPPPPVQASTFSLRIRFPVPDLTILDQAICPLIHGYDEEHGAFWDASGEYEVWREPLDSFLMADR